MPIRRQSHLSCHESGENSSTSLNTTTIRFLPCGGWSMLNTGDVRRLRGGECSSAHTDRNLRNLLGQFIKYASFRQAQGNQPWFFLITGSKTRFVFPTAPTAIDQGLSNCATKRVFRTDDNEYIRLWTPRISIQDSCFFTVRSNVDFVDTIITKLYSDGTEVCTLRHNCLTSALMGPNSVI